MTSEIKNESFWWLLHTFVYRLACRILLFLNTKEFLGLVRFFSVDHLGLIISIQPVIILIHNLHTIEQIKTTAIVQNRRSTLEKMHKVKEFVQQSQRTTINIFDLLIQKNKRMTKTCYIQYFQYLLSAFIHIFELSSKRSLL